ncbi:MAG: hypothetical protein PHS16_01380 [Candidatus Colwellbacteria bacterium]|jgi:hypothetical protein|nr:hypothetical protein [Candidatus Colwellbacteria bacterium]MCK9497407.1 hypothetical protein [Candidatus Colwellbacteria bacterium]MDD3752572.1 hypothetical protein [Candidatus Colwellbacteria bacterium]MDD4818628.1 hypothetical protein [Candidatus Colwellbacteria bacterium]
MSKKISEEFISSECEHSHTKYPVRLGRTIASSLAGFIAGFIVASIGWVAIVYMLQPFCDK